MASGNSSSSIHKINTIVSPQLTDDVGSVTTTSYLASGPLIATGIINSFSTFSWYQFDFNVLGDSEVSNSEIAANLINVDSATITYSIDSIIPSANYAFFDMNGLIVNGSGGTMPQPLTTYNAISNGNQYAAVDLALGQNTVNLSTAIPDIEATIRNIEDNHDHAVSINGELCIGCRIIGSVFGSPSIQIIRASTITLDIAFNIAQTNVSAPVPNITPAIKITNYQVIAQNYADAQSQIIGVSEYYYNAAYEILGLQVFDSELDLLSVFYNAYIASQVVYQQAPKSVITAVNALQSHVLDKARTDPAIDTVNGPAKFNSINQWIDAAGVNDPTLHNNVGRQYDSDGSFTVSNRFATLSERAGFLIIDANIV